MTEYYIIYNTRHEREDFPRKKFRKAERAIKAHDDFYSLNKLAIKNRIKPICIGNCSCQIRLVNE